MPLDISKLAHMGEFSLEIQSLGTVRCLSLNTDHLSQAHKKLGLSGAQGLDVVRWLFGEMARRPVEGHSDEDEAIEGSCLAAEELSSVTDEELEEFANNLIQKNNYLLKTHKGGDIEKSADESACDFLVRVFRHHAAEEKAQWVRMAKPVSSSLLASTTVEAMQRNIALSNQFQDTIDKYTHGHLVTEAERMAAKVKDMAKAASSALHASATAEKATQRNIMQQSALGSIAEANRFLIENSANAAIEKVLKREQYITQAIDPFKDMNRQLEEYSASVSGSMPLKREQDLMRAATGQPPDAQHYLGGISPSATLAKAIHHAEAEQIDAKLKEMAKVAPSAFHANATAEAMQCCLGLSNQHQDAIDKLTLGLSATTPISTESMPDESNNHLMAHHILKNPIHETNEKLGNVVEQIEEWRPTAAKAERLFRENAATTGRLAKIAIWIAAVGLLISAVGLAISSFFSYQSYTDAEKGSALIKESSEKADAQIKALQKEILELATAQREERAALVKAIGDVRRVLPATVKK